MTFLSDLYKTKSLIAVLTENGHGIDIGKSLFINIEK
jgi:hypothetical protein